MTDVTLIVTTHDRLEWLTECLNSIRVSSARAGVRPRVLVVDDASLTLDAAEVARRAGAEYIRLDENVGYAKARVIPLADVRSPYLSFVDDDDILWPNWFRLHLVKAVEGYDVIAASYWETDETGRRRPPTILEPASLEGLLSGFVPLNDGAWLRTETLQGIPWRPDRDKVMMMSMWLALAARGARFTTITEPCWVHRIHGSNMSASLDEQDARFRAEAIAEWTP